VSPALRAAELARRFRSLGATKVLTGPGSGMLPAQSCALHITVPLIFATDVPPMTKAPNVPVYEQTIGESSVRREGKTLHVSSEFLGPGDRVLIVDDMLSKGATAVALAGLASKAGATVVGCGFMMEKEYEGGRGALSSVVQLPRQRIQALVTIKSVTGGNIQVVET